MNPFDFSDCKSHAEIDDAVLRRQLWLFALTMLVIFVLAIADGLR